MWGPVSVRLLLKDSELASSFSSQSGNMKETRMQNFTAKWREIPREIRLTQTSCLFLPVISCLNKCFKGRFGFVEVRFVCTIVSDSLNPVHPIAVQQVVKV